MGTDVADEAASTDPAVLLQQASIWHQDGQLVRAEEAYRRVLSLDPANPDAMNLLATVHHEHGDREMAIRLLRAAIKINPHAGRYWLNLGVVLAASGDRTGSVTAYRRATVEGKGSHLGWPGVIFSMDLHPHAPPSVRLADRRAFNAQHCAALTASAPPHENDPNPDRRLVVGYISADFRNHSAAMVFGPVLDGHDHTKVKVVCYWQQEAPADTITAHIKTLADVWREVNELDDAALAQQIRDDKVDILVDLSGYSTGNRLLTLARKPAPIIVTAWGHVTGLGIDASDYILADAITVPPDHEHLYHEKILRAPCVVAYNPWSPVPEVAAPPAIENGHTTFGYFGRSSKTGEEVWGAWAAILHRVPGSRLILKHADYKHDGYREHIADYFTSLRISSHRVEFRSGTSRYDHLMAHADVDIALEPFPQSGGVTTLEACLMGLPSVALLGNYLNARIAPSILSVLGREDWVVGTTDEYVEKAVWMADQEPRLEDRMQLRADLVASILCRPHDYARAVESEYRRAWVAWCEARHAALLPEPTPLRADEEAA